MRLAVAVAHAKGYSANGNRLGIFRYWAAWSMDRQGGWSVEFYNLLLHYNFFFAFAAKVYNTLRWGDILTSYI